MIATDFAVPQGVRCLIEDCRGRVVAKKLCSKHYDRLKTFGSPTAINDRYGIPLHQRITARSHRAENGCVEWTGARNRDGYGTIKINKKSCLAHRTVFELEHGLIPDGLRVCHHCDNPSCVNVAHLFLGTATDNAADMLEKGRHCYGERHPKTKLSSAQVAEIRSSKESYRVICRRFGIAKSYISKLRRMERRKLA